MNLDIYKKQAAARAAAYIQSGMVVGLGTGSTAVHLVRILGEKLAKGELVNVIGIPTSEATAVEAKRCNIPLTNLSQHPHIDITIDGADEVDPHLNLIKGLGGALLREKIVAAASGQMIVIGDTTKKVSQLGSRAPVPVEVIPFAQSPVFQFLTAIHANPRLRMDKNNPDQPFITDEGNIILDCYTGPIDNPQALAQTIIQQPGVVEHGLFLGMATRVILAGENGIEEMGK
ncbi:MAG: ribose-5-phosphate isomerase RpiA [Candidatus Promineifilaceae bacterium]